MTTLRVIEGGSGSGGDDSGDRPFKEHPLADHLWRAIYPKGAKSLEVIAMRMSRTARRDISEAKARWCVGHVRRHAYSYGWDVPPVEKGRFGFGRKYVAVLVDPNDPEVTLVEHEGHLDFVRKGATSSARTISTMGENAGIALEIFANEPSLSRAEKRAVRAASAMFTAASEVVRDVVTKMTA